MGTYLRDGNINSNGNANTTATLDIDASATATVSSTDPATEGVINGSGNGGSRRRIVWILPRANEFLTLRSDGHYGSGRFCSSRCARRVGGLAKKRMWDLTHGVSTDLYNTTATTTSASQLTGGGSDGNDNRNVIVNREQRSPGEASSTSTTREISKPTFKGLQLPMLPVSMDKLSAQHLENNRGILLSRSSENSNMPPLPPLSGRFTPVAIQPQELEYVRTAVVDKTERSAKRRRIHGSPTKMSLSVILNPS